MSEEKQGKGASSGSGEQVYAILAYLWILCLVPVLMKKEDEFVRFHVRQGLVLFIVEVALGIIGILPFVGPLVYMLGMLVCGLVSVAGIVQVLKGNKWKMPVISDWANKIKII